MSFQYRENSFKAKSTSQGCTCSNSFYSGFFGHNTKKQDGFHYTYYITIAYITTDNTMAVNCHCTASTKVYQASDDCQRLAPSDLLPMVPKQYLIRHLPENKTLWGHSII